MANTKELKKRLKSIKGIEKITQAMKMVATARVKKFQSLAQDSAPYTEHLLNFISDLSVDDNSDVAPLFEKKENVTKVLYIVIGADSGMCGSFNQNVMNKAMERIGKRLEAGHNVSVICVGKKCRQYFERVAEKNHNLKIVMSITDYGANVYQDRIYEIAGKAKDMFLSGETEGVRIIYAKYKNDMSQIHTAVNFLPIDKSNSFASEKTDKKDYSKQIFSENTANMMKSSGGGSSDIIYEPGEAAVLSALMPKYLNNVIYHTVLETMASEFGAKMTAMTAANQNAQDVIAELSREFNKIRQTSITNQLIDIVNGGNAQ